MFRTSVNPTPDLSACEATQNVTFHCIIHSHFHISHYYHKTDFSHSCLSQESRNLYHSWKCKSKYVHNCLGQWSARCSVRGIVRLQHYHATTEPTPWFPLCQRRSFYVQIHPKTPSFLHKQLMLSLSIKKTNSSFLLYTTPLRHYNLIYRLNYFWQQKNFFKSKNSLYLVLIFHSKYNISQTATIKQAKCFKFQKGATQLYSTFK